MSNAGGYTVQVRGLSDVADAVHDPFMRDWLGLFDAQRRLANPFSHPIWVETWLRHFVAADDILLHVVHDSSGQLVGVLPFFRQQVKIGPIKIAKRLTIAGMGLAGTPLEIPGLLAAPGHARAAARAAVEHSLRRDDVDWFEVTVNPQDSWLENDWLRNRPGAYDMHHAVRACVVLPLQPTWELLQRDLKRNVKESLRRSRNRLARDGRPWKVERLTGDDLDGAAVARLLHLHGERADTARSINQHHDAFEDTRIKAFMREVLPALGHAGAASVYELHLDDRHIASQLTLHAPGTLYFHSSGFDPDMWDLGPVTFLQGEAIREAIREGCEWVNYSPGPNVAKLRWSEQLHIYHDFIYGPGERRSRIRETTVSQLSSFSQHRRAIQAARTRRPEPKSRLSRSSRSTTSA